MLNKIKLIVLVLSLIVTGLLLGCGGGSGNSNHDVNDTDNNNNSNNNNNIPQTPTTGTLVGVIDTSKLPQPVNSTDPELNRAFLRVIDPIDEIGMSEPLLLTNNQYNFSIVDVPVGNLYLQVKVKVEAIIYPNQSTDVTVVTTNIPITIQPGATTDVSTTLTMRNISSDITNNTDKVEEFDQVELRGTKKYSNKLYSWGWDVDYKKGTWNFNPPEAPKDGEQEAKPIPPDDKPNDYWDKNNDGVIDWFEEILKNKEEDRRAQDQKANEAILKAKATHGDEPDPLPYNPPDPDKPPKETIIGIKGKLLDNSTKEVLGPVSTTEDNNYQLIANHYYSIVPARLVVELKFVDNNVKIIERNPLSTQVFVMMADGAAFEPPNYYPYDLEIKASQNTNPTNLAKGRLVFGFEPKDKDGYLVKVDPTKPIPNELLASPSIIVKVTLKPDPRASRVTEVLYGQSMSPGAIQHLFFYVKPDYLAPLDILNEENVAPIVLLVPVIENADTERKYSVDPTRSTLEFTYQPDGGVPEVGFFSAYEYDTSLNMWKYKIGYGPSMLFVTQDYPVGLYKLLYYNNLGDGSVPIFMHKKSSINRTISVDPTRPPFGDLSLKSDLYLHPGNLLEQYKGIVSFSAE